MPYQITAAQFQSFEDDYQNLAVGLIDGALVIIDLVLGVEKHFLEKHPSEISTLAFYDNKALVSGSICGRVNISDLDAIEASKVKAKREPKFSMCQNCQDRKIPVAYVSVTSEFGIALAIDVEGNCRFYDLHRFKKMAKVNSANVRIDNESHHLIPTKFRLLQSSCLQMTNDSMVGVIQSGTIFKDFEADAAMRVAWKKAQAEKLEEAAMAAAKNQNKGGKGAPAAVAEDVEPDVLLEDTQESEILQPKLYSDHKKKLKSIDQIIRDIPEANLFVQRSTLSIFRFEDVIFTLYPHLASLRRKGQSTKEIFFNMELNKN